MQFISNVVGNVPPQTPLERRDPPATGVELSTHTDRGYSSRYFLLKTNEHVSVSYEDIAKSCP